ncbi:endonuclease MutS2 [Clostridium sp. D2Q-11]|uniref:Endonuclease MutS2 n=1 Tax=Anaeromonas frigoriresistens TaxID=2683708 RepID=A0A942Z6J4_9FIRM|nr:endonuclease MutS2 [Anaeromonas frigoriresistens]MBS4538536.1 endonuclease MutS2 [Anaeromonas frigoriresistens]
MNNNTLKTLEYNKLKEKVKEFCISGLGKELIDNLTPHMNIDVIKKRLDETSEAKNIFNNSNHIPFDGIYDINNLIDKVDKVGQLDPSEMLKISDFLRGCRRIKKFMIEQVFYAPTLSEYALSLSEFRDIEEEINQAIRNNRVDSSASKELNRVRRKIDNIEEKIQEKLNKYLTSQTYKKYIQEFYISKRNEKYVIPIKSSYKNKINGTVIDVSTKGSTVFIEPNSVSKLNNELSSLRYEEKLEEYQILAYLTGLIYEKIRRISINLELISQYDMIFAKAKYSNKIKGIEPNINSYGYINIIKGKHPLLEEDCVPLDFTIGNDFRSLVITGPNAGGKTIALKTVGLLTLAVQSGFHIPAEEETEISVFDNVFVDIGDNQSIENALSTFSSHMKNISDIMSKTNKASLVLFDEIGTGTEPNEGAGLAIAILEELYKKGAITVSTTHYGEIKNYAEDHPDFQNAHMVFNPETLEPLYKLVIGEGGESNALWISKRMGINDGVLKRAKSYIENKQYNYDILKDNKTRKKSIVIDENSDGNREEELRVGDKVKILETDEEAIVYKEKDKYNNIELMVDDDFITLNIRRVELSIKRELLYPEGYDLDSLFVSYEKRKLERDIERGSKKALKKIYKEIKNK